MTSDSGPATGLDRPPWFHVDPTAAVRHPTLRDMRTHWESLKDGAELPLASRIDPLDMRRHLGDLFMVRVDNEGRDFTYSLIGTRITEILDRDMTGRRVEDTFPPGHPVLEVYRMIHRRRIPVRTHGQVSWIGKDYKRFESLMLPLTDPAGTVIKILGAAVYFTAP